MELSKLLLLLATIFSISVAEPKPPEKFPVRPTYVRTIVHTQPKAEKKTLYNMTDAELNALSVKKKAKLVHLSVKSFKEMTRVVNHEAGAKMEDKVLVAAVIWNRKNCKQFPNKMTRVLNDGGFYNVRKTKAGSARDKKAQLAILLAYRDLKKGKIAHNVLYFNCISYRTRNPKRFVKYKHVHNYFIKDIKCKCKWCSN